MQNPNFAFLGRSAASTPAARARARSFCDTFCLLYPFSAHPEHHYPAPAARVDKETRMQLKQSNYKIECNINTPAEKHKVFPTDTKICTNVLEQIISLLSQTRPK